MSDGMIGELVCLLLGSAGTYAIMASTGTEDARKRQALHEKLNQEQTDNHQKNMQSLTQANHNMQNNMSFSAKFMQTMHELYQNTVNLFVDIFRELSEMKEQLESNIDNWISSTFKIEQALQQDTRDLNDVMTALSSQMNTTTQTLDEVSTIKIEQYQSLQQKNESLTAENIQLKNALKDAHLAIDALLAQLPGHSFQELPNTNGSYPCLN